MIQSGGYGSGLEVGGEKAGRTNVFEGPEGSRIIPPLVTFKERRRLRIVTKVPGGRSATKRQIAPSVGGPLTGSI